MASNRHLGRIVALQSLYEHEFRTASSDDSVDIEAIMSRNLERYKTAIDDTTFVRSLTLGVLDKLSQLDDMLKPIAPDWPIDQIARIDRVTLRIGLFELLYFKEIVPPKVAINEAVELAKAFGSDNSSKFINGVLGTAYRTLVQTGAEANSDDTINKTQDDKESVNAQKADDA